ncbi:hypothetical protein E5C33_04430 [Stenotrophomonas maltophilia]|uniref:hypothetical protein n=1 Tax=Stenotrophomonas maltophilia TaxID=40324 RepID=UPI001076B9B5|nr:hypothetical protein [Stenotrophomonas maltophilia]TFZ46446.1 hypothetical protein E5C33_04430 [Stenotrophomonas maltophilia]
MVEPLYCSPLQLFCQPLSWWSSAAAWAQAVLSAAAIVGAAMIARWQHRKALRQRVQAITAIAAFTVDAAASYLKEMRHYEHKPVARPWNLDQLTEAARAFGAIPAHELPDNRLVYPVLALNDGLRELLTLAQQLDARVASTGSPISANHMNSIEGLADRIEKGYEAVVAVDRLVNPLTWRDVRRMEKGLGK